MSRQDVLARGVEQCKTLTARYLAGFDDASRTKQGMDLPNHVAWCLGHCALYMHRAAEKIDGGPLPETDFIAGAGAGNGSLPGAFGTESVCYGSTPVDDPRAMPSLRRCIEIYNAACDRLANAARGASDAKLDEVTVWGSGETTLEALVLRMIFHNGAHCGQITDLRRSLGMGSVFA